MASQFNSRCRLLVRNTVQAALIAAIVAVAGSTAVAGPQTDSFTYQGELRSGTSLPNGSYDFRFRLYDAAAAGTQIGATSSATLAVADGKFTVTLSFPGAFAGQERWIEIDVRETGPGAYTTLTPRQKLASTPYGTYALTAATANTATTAATATNALNLNGQPASFYTNAANLTTGTLPSARVTGTYSNALTLNNVANVFAGNGAALTGLNAANLSAGTLPDARLSGNVAMRNAANAFSVGGNNFTGNTGFGQVVSPSYPVHVQLTGAGGIASYFNTLGGSSILVNNDASGNAAIAYGLNMDIAGTTTRYGALIDINGTATGTGYGAYVTNESPTGRGYYALMTGTGTTYGIQVSNNSPTGYGGFFNNTSTTGITYGLYCENNSTDGYGLFALHDATTGTGPAVFGRTDSTSSSAFAIHGQVNTTTAGGFSSGIRGENKGTGGGGVGVYGSHAGSGWGVYGTSATTGIGVYGTAVGGYGVYGSGGAGGTGVRGLATGAGSYGGYFTASAGGTGIYVSGTASVDILQIRGGADLAEKFEVSNNQTIEPGMVVMIDEEHPGSMTLATGAYNRKVAGVVSGADNLDAGMILGSFDGTKNAHPIALTGRVWTFVDATDGAVRPGDLLTTSDTPGYARVVSDFERANGAAIGKAMTSLAKGEKGKVLVLVNLQ